MFLNLHFQAQSAFAVSKADKEIMDKARVAYEKSDLQTALNYYNKISVGSDYWVEALEEKAWTQLRQKNTNEATSLSKTLLSEVLSPLLGPEAYFLQSLIEYRLCDYRSIFKTIKLFKTRYAERTKEVQALADSGNNKALGKAIKVLFAKVGDLSALKAESFGAEIQYLPRYFYRDQSVLIAVKSQNQGGIVNRIRELAKQDLNEISDILRKLQLVETQVVQQVYAYENQLSEKRKASFKNKGYNSDEMYFPYDGEIWLDEIDQFQSSTEKCPVDPFENPMPGRKTIAIKAGGK
jgi:hypothetical protein